MSQTFTPRRLSILLLLLVFAGTGCSISKNPISGRSRAYAYSWQQEIQLGAESDPQIVAEYGVYPDARVSAYVDSVGQVLVGYSHLRRPDADPEFQATAFHFRVLDSPVVNAFALPGGYVYVTRGMLAHLENEAQLAVVLGHEIGHVAGRHGSKRATSQMLGTALLIGGAVGGGMIFGEDVGSSILQLGSTAVQLLFLSYGRNDERESDALGVEYASLAGYDASEGSAVFRSLKRIGEKAGQSLPSFLSTHPDPGEREQTIARMSADWATRTRADLVKRSRLLDGVSDMIVGENPRNGFERSGTFYHPDLALQFPIPTGFQTVNQASRVALVGPDQKAMITFTMESANTARDAADAFSGTQGLTVVQSGVGSSNGLPARFVVAELTGDSGDVYRVRAHYVEYGGRVYGFVGVAMATDYSNWEPAFTRTMQGMAPLRDSSILAIEPSRIQLARVDRPMPFRSLVTGSNTGGIDAESLAIMNQLMLDETVASGTTVKLVR